jgi:hypothetical protein
VLGDSHVNFAAFAPLNFLNFSVGRNSADFASPRSRKSLAGHRFVSCSGAIFTQFRLGDGTKSSSGEPLFIGPTFVSPLFAGATSIRSVRIASAAHASAGANMFNELPKIRRRTLPGSIQRDVEPIR